MTKLRKCSIIVLSKQGKGVLSTLKKQEKGLIRMKKADRKILEIEKYLGIKLKKEETSKRKYFNVDLEENVAESRIYLELINLCRSTNIASKVEPNGYSRIAIYY